MRDHPSHRDGETGWREIAIVAKVLIEKTNGILRRRESPTLKLTLPSDFEPDISDFETAFEPYIKRIQARARLDVLKKYERYGTLKDQFETVSEINDLNFQIAQRENPDEPVR